ncbi:unnamed protein product [Effrenium voratum]|uniref:Uncharacterized protein n=1 Tax=Effrenium voratum TaxID=2562239 RepID=A0AA36MM91_9DINO|nr:unnamed protein product [Effrenium voratum]CAJ1373260.1 unnamed protein product [Effrenium voratum]
MDSKQVSFFSNKMENFLSDSARAEQKARQQAMSTAVREAQSASRSQNGHAMRDVSPEAPSVRGAQHLQREGFGPERHKVVRMTSALYTPLRPVQAGLASAQGSVAAPSTMAQGALVRPDNAVQRTDSTIIAMARPVQVLRPHPVLMHDQAEFMKALSPKRPPLDIAIEAESHEVGQSCCFWDCRGPD